MSELPHGWAEGSLADVCQLITDGTHHSPENNPVGDYRYVTAKNIKPWGLDLSKITYVDTATHTEIYRRCPPAKGDVLYIKDGATTGIAIVNPLDEPFSMLSSVALLKPHSELMSGEFLCNFLNSPETVAQMTGDMTGSAIRRLTLSTISRRPIVIPPFREQRRIVAKIDGLTGNSGRAREHLDHIPRLVEKYKQAVLAAAFRGELVGLSAAETELPHDRCWNLPPSWRWAHFGDVVEIASNLVKPEDVPDLPHIAPDNIEGGTGRLLPFRTIREDEVISAKHRFFAGQVIYSKIRPYLRKAVLVDFDGACSADMYPLNVTPELDPAYLLYWLISEPFAAFTTEHEGRTVLPKINQSGLNKTPVPLPPLPDQRELVRRVSSAFTWIDRLASDAASARKLIDHLDQAVLAKAFRGGLVPQDPNDEPASVLLERIKAARGATPARRGRRRGSN